MPKAARNRARVKKPPARASNTRRPLRRNSEEKKAEALAKAFHGRPATKIRDVEEVHFERTKLADLGRLIQLRVWTDDEHLATLNYEGTGVRVGASGDGGQIYFVDGDQTLDLKKLGVDRYLPKDHVKVGAVQSIVYHTKKAFHNFEATDYKHEFGEEGGTLPILHYDVLSKLIYLTDGSYQVRPEGIVN